MSPFRAKCMTASTAVLTIGLLAATPGHAQGNAPAAAAGPSGAQGSGDDKHLGDIIVTARRTAENVQKIPLAITVQTATDLKQHQVNDLFAIRNLTPSLQVQAQSSQVGALQFAIRGIGTATQGPQVESSVGLVIDDVPMARAELGNVQFFDLDRVEVLRGPQGMLFGKNASAGLINIITAAPKLGKEEFLLDAQYGNMDQAPGGGNRARMNVAGNMPIGQNAALRIDGFVQHDDEYAGNIYDKSQNLGMTQYGVRAKLRWDATDHLKFLLSGDYAHETGPGESVYEHTYDAPGGLIAGLDAISGITPGPQNKYFASDGPNINHFNVYGGSLKADLDLGGGYTLTNIVGARKYVAFSWLDVDSTPSPLWNTTVNQNYRQITEELRLTSPRDKPLTWQGGFFYLNFKGLLQDNFQGGNPLVPFFPPPLGPTLPPGFTELFGSTSDLMSTNQSYAGYFEGQYKLTSKLAVTAGVRYTHDSFGFSSITVTDPGALVAPIPVANLTNSTKQNNVSYRFSANYTIIPDVMAYASYARGYKGPTFDLFSANLVKPEIPKVIELGLKSTLFDRRLRFNLALYHEVFDGFQAQALNTATTTVQTINAGQLKAKGVEAEFTALPFEGFTLSGGVTYNDAKYKGLVVACAPYETIAASGRDVCFDGSVAGNLAGTTDASGNQLANAPKWTETITARYEHPVSENWKGFIQGDGYFRSHFNFSPIPDPHTAVGSTAIFGLSVGAEQADGHLSATVFVRNLTDKRVPQYLGQVPVAGIFGDTAKGGDYYQLLGAESYRTIGITLSYRM